MSEYINRSLSKEFRLGQTGFNNQGLKITIIVYRKHKDIDVQFEDGTIVKNRQYDGFLKGTIANPNYKDSRIIDRTGETKENNQKLKMTIIAYRKYMDIDVQFEDGIIVKNRTYDSFLKGAIAYPMEDRIGETKKNNQDLIMTIIAYRDSHDIDIQFEDGTIVKNKQYSAFSNGQIANPNMLSDGVSIPEKFMWNILKQLSTEFIIQLNKLTFEWCENYRYDFYIPSLNMIIETHGMQHYEKGFESCGGKTLEEEQKNDRLKKELALNNNIKNYIVVDCRYSEFDWLKENVSKELNEFFDLSNIDWNLVWENSLKNFVWETKRLVEKGYNNIQIAEILCVNKTTIEKYKKQSGIKTQHEIKQENLLKTKELVQQGKSIKEIAEILNVNRDTIRNYKKQLGIKNQRETKQENLLKIKELVQQSKSTKEIAEILNVSEGTINNYKRELNL